MEATAGGRIGRDRVCCCRLCTKKATWVDFEDERGQVSKMERHPPPISRVVRARLRWLVSYLGRWPMLGRLRRGGAYSQ
jgi:hypothetical protein